MTKAQAIDRVCKLRALAKSTTSPNERETATKQAAILIAKHEILDSDVAGSGKSAAFDDLASAFSRYSTEHPDIKSKAPTLAEIIEGILGHTKKLPRGQKTVLVDQVGTAIKIAKFVFGNSNKTLNDIATIVETVLKSYDVVS